MTSQRSTPPFEAHALSALAGRLARGCVGRKIWRGICPGCRDCASPPRPGGRARRDCDKGEDPGEDLRRTIAGVLSGRIEPADHPGAKEYPGDLYAGSDKQALWAMRSSRPPSKRARRLKPSAALAADRKGAAELPSKPEDLASHGRRLRCGRAGFCEYKLPGSHRLVDGADRAPHRAVLFKVGGHKELLRRDSLQAAAHSAS